MYEDEDYEDDTIPCPQCGEDVYEDAPQCPSCGEYIIDRNAGPWSRQPKWFYVIVLVVVVILILSMVF